MPYAAYPIDITYRFGVTLRRKGIERCAEVTCDSPLFVNVLQAIREQHPGWCLWESWEIPQAQPAQPDGGSKLEKLLQGREQIRTSEIAADALIGAHYRKQAAAIA